VRGEDAAREQRFSNAVELLDKCLSQANLDAQARFRALKVRAFVYYELRDYTQAVSDQEAAFSIQEPAEYRDFINYALYLRHAGRFEESLRAARSAEAIEEKDGTTSMMTQYHLGWTLLELGRPREAVEAFSRGIPFQPEYPFVYWRRGLAYEALGQRAKARKDFELTAKYLSSPQQEAAAGDLLPVIRAKLRSYGLDTAKRR
jgi:tetratricopeptide (TPR) repeat protein